MSVSISVNMDKWVKEIRIAGKSIYQQSEKVQAEAAEQLLSKIVSYTPEGNPSLWKYPAPKGYVPGTLKKSWEISYGKEIEIYNNQPYAVRVEFGWSTQAPEGMMRRALMEFPSILNQAAVRYKV